ncbi:MAG: P-loop NTPase [Peptococcaceae bacterium]|nr:P-loop NTPase [Peptococcaceae bacterium]
MKVLLATSMEDLEDALEAAQGSSFSVIAKVRSREDVVTYSSELRPDTVVLSPELSGQMDILDVIYQLRSLDIRIVFIAGSLDPGDVTITKIIEYGVRDIIFGEIRIGQVIDILKSASGNQNVSVPKQLEPFDEDEEEHEGPLKRIVRLGGEVKKSIPRVSLRTRKSVSEIENVIAVCSPTSSGKTFVAVNLATALAQQGYTVALLDCDIRSHAVYAWLNCPTGEEGLVRAMQDTEDPLAHAFQPHFIPGLYVITNDPFENKTLLTEKKLIGLIKALAGVVDLVIIDTPGEFSMPVTKTAIDLAGTVILVADPDYNHLLKLQAEMDGLPEDFNFEKMVVVANNFPDSEKLPVDDVQKAAGLNVACVLPAKPTVPESIKAGIPVVLYDSELRETFEKLLAEPFAMEQIG